MLLEEENQTSMRFHQAMNLVLEDYTLLIFQSQLFSVKTLHVFKQSPEYFVLFIWFYLNFLVIIVFEFELLVWGCVKKEGHD